MHTPATVSAPNPTDATPSPPPDRPTRSARPATEGGRPMPPRRNDIRNDIRDDNGTTPCLVCACPFTPIRRQRYCTPVCRQSAWRTRLQDSTPPPTVVLAPRAPRRQTTVYQCPECDTRHLAHQWCDDSRRPPLRAHLDTSHRGKVSPPTWRPPGHSPATADTTATPTSP